MKLISDWITWDDGRRSGQLLEQDSQERGGAHGGSGSTFNEKHDNNGYKNKEWGYAYSYQTEEGEDLSN